ncbi:MAG: hypothetical protein PHT88_05515 [Candidatus Moranbacteria bacterium]|nr:hypothetical protein [Candidatus Moranbacteria bacterium]
MLKKILIARALFFISAVMFPISASAATPALVGHARGITSGPVTSFNITKSTTAGNLLVIVVANSNSPTTFTVSSPGLSFSQDTSNTGGGNPFIEDSFSIWSAPNVTGGSHTVTVNASNSDYIRWYAVEFSGIATSNHVISSANNKGFSTSVATGNITTGQNDTLLFEAIRTDGDEGAHGDITVGSGYTELAPMVDAEPEQKLMAGYRVVTSGTWGDGFTLQMQDGGGWVSGLVAYAPAGGIPPPPIDTQAPTLAQITAIPTLTRDKTPNYVFSSNEAGTISYTGDCSSSSTSASASNNTITLSALTRGTHSNCSIRVTDTAGNQSSILSIPSFTLTYASDLNLDRSVNIADFGLLNTNYGTTNAAGDVNLDGVVNMLDFGVMRTEYGGSV